GQKRKHSSEPSRSSDVAANTPAKKPPHKSQQPQFTRCEPALAGIAPETLAVPPSHKMSWARRSGGSKEKLAVRTYRLKTVMLDDHGPPRNKAENQRRQRGAG